MKKRMILKKWELHTKTIIQSNGGVTCIPSSEDGGIHNYFFELTERQAPPPSSLHNQHGEQQKKNRIINEIQKTKNPSTKQASNEGKKDHHRSCSPLSQSPTNLESYNNINLESYGVDMI